MSCRGLNLHVSNFKKMIMTYLSKFGCILGLFCFLIGGGHAFAGDTKKERATDETEEAYEQRLAREQPEEDNQGEDESSDEEIDTAKLLGVDRDMSSPGLLLRPRNIRELSPHRPFFSGFGSDAGFFAVGYPGGDLGQDEEANRGFNHTFAAECPSPEEDVVVYFINLLDSYFDSRIFHIGVLGEGFEGKRDEAVAALKKVFDVASEDEKKRISNKLRLQLVEIFYHCEEAPDDVEAYVNLWRYISDCMTAEDNKSLGLRFWFRVSSDFINGNPGLVDLVFEIAGLVLNERTPEGKHKALSDFIERFAYSIDDGLDELRDFMLELTPEDFDLEVIITLLKKDSSALFFHLWKKEWKLKLVLSSEEIESLLQRINFIVDNSSNTLHRTRLLHYLLDAVYAQFVGSYMNEALCDAVRLNLPFLINGLFLDEGMKVNSFAKNYLQSLSSDEVALDEMRLNLRNIINKDRYLDVTLLRGDDAIHAESLLLILRVLSLGKEETPEAMLRLACEMRVSAANLIKMWPSFTASCQSSDAMLSRHLIEYALFEGSAEYLRKVGVFILREVYILMPGPEVLDLLNKMGNKDETLQDILGQQQDSDLETAFEEIFGAGTSVLSDHPRPNEGEDEPDPKRHCTRNEADGNASEDGDPNSRARKHFYKKDY